MKNRMTERTAARLLPAVRTFVSIPAGVAHMPLGRFLAWSTAGTLIFCAAFTSAAFTSAGYLAGANVARIEEIMRPVTALIVGGILVWYVWRQLTWKARHR